MKRIFLTILVIGSMAVLFSCSPAKKPDQTRNKTFIVPEVSRVTIDAVDLKSAPGVIRNIAKDIQDRDATTLARADGKTYIIVSQGDRTRNYDMKVDEVLQRLPQQGFTWLEVRLSYSRKKEPRAGAEPVLTVVRADVSSPPEGVGFTLAGLEPAGRPPAPAPEKTAAPSPQDQGAGASIEQPAPNQEITSPVKVIGAAAAPDKLRLRLSTRGGQILKEENLSPSPGTGAFSADIKYSPPEMPTPGEITIISPSGGDEKVLARVPVVIK